MKLLDIQQAQLAASELAAACQMVILRTKQLCGGIKVTDVGSAAPGYDHMIATAERLKPLLRKFRTSKRRSA